MKTNPNAMESLRKNSIFTNVATTSDGGLFWEGLEDEVDLSKVEVTDWMGRPWKQGSKTPASHPNARYAMSAAITARVIDITSLRRTL
jgi:phosphoenolpyruvate carboxykinase (GTP)